MTLEKPVPRNQTRFFARTSVLPHHPRGADLATVLRVSRLAPRWKRSPGTLDVEVIVIHPGEKSICFWVLKQDPSHRGLCSVPLADGSTIPAWSRADSSRLELRTHNRGKKNRSIRAFAWRLLNSSSGELPSVFPWN